MSPHAHPWQDSEAGFVIDDTLVLELYMQVWEPEAIRTQGSPATLARCCTPLAVPPPSLAGDLGDAPEVCRAARLVGPRRSGPITGPDPADSAPDFWVNLAELARIPPAFGRALEEDLHPILPHSRPLSSRTP